jgi:choline dehydrogenase
LIRNFQAERWSSPNDPNLPETNHFNISNHNTDGILGVTAPYYTHPFNDILFETIRDVSDEFPFLLDLNNGSPIGIGE